MTQATTNKAPSKTREFIKKFLARITTGQSVPVNRPAGLNVSTGTVQNVADALTPVGLVTAPSDGNFDHLTGSSTYNYAVNIEGDVIQESLTVTGVSSRADVGKAVYATDNQTFTLTPTDATSIPAGYVCYWRTGTTCDVCFFSLDAQVKMAKPRRARLDLGIIGTNALGGTSADTLISRTVYDHFKVISFHGECINYDTAAVAGDQDLNLSNGAVDVTGGVLTLAYTDVDAAGDQAAVVDATAITAANEFHPGDTLVVEMAASGTGFTADTTAMVQLFAVVEYMVGY